MPKKHLPQILFNMWETGSEFCDFISYDPRFIEPKHRIFVKRVYMADHEEMFDKMQMKVEIAIEEIENDLMVVK